jgi:hypothetical protein
MENMNVDHAFVKLVVDIMDNTEEEDEDDTPVSGGRSRVASARSKSGSKEPLSMPRPPTVMADYVEVKPKWKCGCC